MLIPHQCTVPKGKIISYSGPCSAIGFHTTHLSVLLCVITPSFVCVCVCARIWFMFNFFGYHLSWTVIWSVTWWSVKPPSLETEGAASLLLSFVWLSALVIWKMWWFHCAVLWDHIREGICTATQQQQQEGIPLFIARRTNTCCQF